MSIDWVKVSEAVLAGCLTLIVSFATVIFHNWLSGRREKKKENTLYQLAVLRGKGVELRNRGKQSELTADDLQDWLSKVKHLDRAR